MIWLWILGIIVTYLVGFNITHRFRLYLIKTGYLNSDDMEHWPACILWPAWWIFLGFLYLYNCVANKITIENSLKDAILIRQDIVAKGITYGEYVAGQKEEKSSLPIPAKSNTNASNLPRVK